MNRLRASYPSWNAFCTRRSPHTTSNSPTHLHPSWKECPTRRLYRRGHDRNPCSTCQRQKMKNGEQFLKIWSEDSCLSKAIKLISSSSTISNVRKSVCLIDLRSLVPPAVAAPHHDDRTTLSLPESPAGVPPEHRQTNASALTVDVLSFNSKCNTLQCTGVWSASSEVAGTVKWSRQAKVSTKMEWNASNFHLEYTPIRVRQTLDLPKFLESPDGEALWLKTDLKFLSGVLPGAPGISDSLERPKSLTVRSKRRKHGFRSNADGGVLSIYDMQKVTTSHKWL